MPHLTQAFQSLIIFYIALALNWAALRLRRRLSPLSFVRCHFVGLFVCFFVLCIFKAVLNIKVLIAVCGRRRQGTCQLAPCPSGHTLTTIGDQSRGGKCWHSWENILIICAKSWQRGPKKANDVWNAKLLFSMPRQTPCRRAGRRARVDVAMSWLL